MNISPTISVNQVISGVITDLEINESKYYARMRNRAFDFLTETYKAVYVKDIKQVFLMIPDNRRLPAPPDMIAWIRVGIQQGDVIQTLEYNADMSSLTPNAETKPQARLVWPDDDLYNRFGSRWNNGYYTSGPIYGYGLGKYRGEFMYAENTQEFVFSSSVDPQQIILQYQYDNFKNFDEPILITQGAAALRNYLMWQHTLINGDRAISESFRRDYYLALKQLQHVLTDTIIQNTFKLTMSSVKQSGS